MAPGKRAFLELAQETYPPFKAAMNLDPRVPEEARGMVVSAGASLLLLALREGREVRADAGPQRSPFLPSPPRTASSLGARDCSPAGRRRPSGRGRTAWRGSRKRRWAARWSSSTRAAATSPRTLRRWSSSPASCNSTFLPTRPLLRRSGRCSCSWGLPRGLLVGGILEHGFGKVNEEAEAGRRRRNVKITSVRVL